MVTKTIILDINEKINRNVNRTDLDSKIIIDKIMNLTGRTVDNIESLKIIYLDTGEIQITYDSILLALTTNERNAILTFYQSQTYFKAIKVNN